jgi:hypothetical protein
VVFGQIEANIPQSHAHFFSLDDLLKGDNISPQYRKVTLERASGKDGRSPTVVLAFASEPCSEIIREHVTLEVESIDRMYLNVYQPQLQRDLGVVGFFRHHRGQAFASSVLMATMTRTFVSSIESFAKAQKIPVITFHKGQRKDDIAKSYRAKFTKDEGVVFIGKAQERAAVWRTEKRYHQQSGATYPWQVRSTAMVNHYYIYVQDRDFGPFFIKFCSYFPYNAKLCLNSERDADCYH